MSTQPSPYVCLSLHTELLHRSAVTARPLSINAATSQQVRFRTPDVNVENLYRNRLEQQTPEGQNHALTQQRWQQEFQEHLIQSASEDVKKSKGDTEETANTQSCITVLPLNASRRGLQRLSFLPNESEDHVDQHEALWMARLVASATENSVEPLQTLLKRSVDEEGEDSSPSPPILYDATMLAKMAFLSRFDTQPKSRLLFNSINGNDASPTVKTCETQVAAIRRCVENRLGFYYNAKYGHLAIAKSDATPPPSPAAPTAAVASPQEAGSVEAYRIDEESIRTQLVQCVLFLSNASRSPAARVVLMHHSPSKEEESEREIDSAPSFSGVSFTKKRPRGTDSPQTSGTLSLSSPRSSSTAFGVIPRGVLSHSSSTSEGGRQRPTAVFAVASRSNRKSLHTSNIAGTTPDHEEIPCGSFVDVAVDSFPTHDSVQTSPLPLSSSSSPGTVVGRRYTCFSHNFFSSESIHSFMSHILRTMLIFPDQCQAASASQLQSLDKLARQFVERRCFQFVSLSAHVTWCDYIVAAATSTGASSPLRTRHIIHAIPADRSLQEKWQSTLWIPMFSSPPPPSDSGAKGSASFTIVVRVLGCDEALKWERVPISAKNDDDDDGDWKPSSVMELQLTHQNTLQELLSAIFQS